MGAAAWIQLIRDPAMEELGRLVPRVVARQGPGQRTQNHQGNNRHLVNSSQTPRPKSTVLECRVCEDTFELHGEKIPRLLFCGHTLCHACLARLPTQDGFISCPFDRQQTLLGNNGVWELNKNFALMEMIERIQIQENSDMLCSALLVDNERSLGVC